MRWVYGIAVLSASALALASCGKKEQAAAPENGGLAVESGPPGVAGAPASPGAVTPPQRKAGLWRITTTTAGMAQTMRLCTDAATEAKFSVWGGQASKDMCAKQEIKRGPGGAVSFNSVCDMGSGGKTTTTGTIKGDFSKAYTVSAKTVTEGAGAPQMNGARDMTMEATWLGACPADFKPGDMEVAAGVKFNVLDMNAMKGMGQ